MRPHKVRDLVLGRALDPLKTETRHSLALVAFLAWVGLGADGLSSSAYGPEEAFKALGIHTHFGLYLAVATAVTVFIISLAYNQIIELFPTGGGGYRVATSLIGPYAGLTAGAALIVDYVLTIAISIASGTDAMFSLLPVAWQPWKLYVELLLAVVLIVLNLRGMQRVDPDPAADLPRLRRHALRADRLRRAEPRGRTAESRARHARRDRQARARDELGLRRGAVPEGVLARRRYLHRDRGGLEQRAVAEGAARPHRQADDAVHGDQPRLHGRRHHPAVPAVARACRSKAAR